MSTSMRRRKLSNVLLELLTATGKPVGDSEAPPDSGWTSNANATSSVFVPYTALLALAASRSQGSFDDSQDLWLMPYKIIGVGVSREQCDWISDAALDVLDSLEHTQLDLGTSGTWKVMQVQVVTLDGAARIELTEPPYWQRGDTVSVWLTKE